MIFADLAADTQREIREMIANRDSAFTGDAAQATAAEISDLLQELEELKAGHE